MDGETVEIVTEDKAKTQKTLQCKKVEFINVKVVKLQEEEVRYKYQEIKKLEIQDRGEAMQDMNLEELWI